MASLNVNHPGNSLAVWLAGHHPELFLAALKQARAAKLAKQARLHGLIGLADDTTTFDPSSDLTASFDPNAASVISDSTPSGASFINSLADTPTSAGSNLGLQLASAGTTVWDGLSSVGSWVGNNIGTLSNLAKVYYGAQAASAQAQTQQQVLQTQIARAAVGQTAAPITYSTNSAGQLVPVYATTTQQGSVYQPLTSQGVASLAPSSVRVFLSQYGLYIGLAALVVVGVAMRRRN